MKGQIAFMLLEGSNGELLNLCFSLLCVVKNLCFFYYFLNYWYESGIIICKSRLLLYSKTLCLCFKIKNKQRTTSPRKINIKSPLFECWNIWQCTGASVLSLFCWKRIGPSSIKVPLFKKYPMTWKSTFL